MPQLFSPVSSPRHHQYYQDDSVTLKSLRIGTTVSQDSNEESTAEEVIKSDEEARESADEASPQYSSVSSDVSEIE